MRNKGGHAVMYSMVRITVVWWLLQLFRKTLSFQKFVMRARRRVWEAAPESGSRGGGLAGDQAAFCSLYLEIDLQLT